MAKRRCAYCGQREGHGHSVRCSVTRHGLDPCYKEDATGVAAERDRAIEQRENANAATLRAEAERDRLRQALERCQRELDRREQALRDTSHQLSLAGAALLDAEAELDRCREALLRVFRDRREPDKVFAQVSTAVGFDALVETGLVRPLVRDGDRSAYVEAPASNQKEVGG